MVKIYNGITSEYILDNGRSFTLTDEEFNELHDEANEENSEEVYELEIQIENLQREINDDCDQCDAYKIQVEDLLLQIPSC